MSSTQQVEDYMATYKELKAQVEALAEKAEAARAAEFQAVVEDIRAKVAEYGITEKDIFGGRRGRVAAKKVAAPVEAKYRDPKTGATWSGRGRAPAWIKDAKNRNRFLIQE
ncbi:DNA-binding protein [Burkholderia aenigmatica]|uniref:DNA-binding protein n=2 Tax=Burkholderia aenigmatica TaxID=2015348 RepID=A0A6P2RB53_9BURK|nr:DNA-binding protein [Burkholderia aenigmatica]